MAEPETPPEIPLYAMVQAIIENYSPEDAAQLLTEHFENELVAHCRHSAAVGCSRCIDLLEEVNGERHDQVLDEIVSHMTLESDLHHEGV